MEEYLLISNQGRVCLIDSIHTFMRMQDITCPMLLPE